ncbi:MAG: hypothetical protein OEM28_07535 [Nitrosopumilus sp.]|nr:hypothetical protein [Nitrosopumilus sp.]MDH3488113.1 hypothetical protein [Nitrosopumilus sp.]
MGSCNTSFCTIIITATEVKPDYGFMPRSVVNAEFTCKIISSTFTSLSAVIKTRYSLVGITNHGDITSP